MLSPRIINIIVLIMYIMYSIFIALDYLNPAALFRLSSTASYFSIVTKILKCVGNKRQSSLMYVTSIVF